MKTFTLVLTILGVGTLASIIGQEVDMLLPHSLTQCQTAQGDNGLSTTQCVTITVTSHLG